MLKKFTALFLSLLICLSLTAGRVQAVDPSGPNGVPVWEEYSEAKNTDDPNNPIMPALEEDPPGQVGDDRPTS